MTLLKDIDLTLIHIFYNDGDHRLPLQFEAWRTYPDWVWDKIKIILIDDCSDLPLESHYLKGNDLNLNLKIYRINEDLKYNIPGAWNLGFHVADTDWVYAFDSDHVHTRENFVKLLTELEVEDDSYYQLERRRHTFDESLLKRGKVATGSWLVRKEHWETLDGLDEDLVGEYSGSRGHWDHDFTHRLSLLLEHCSKPEGLMIEEYLPDYFGLDPDIHAGWHNKINRRRHAAKKRGEVEHPTDMLRFTWDLVYERERT